MIVNQFLTFRWFQAGSLTISDLCIFGRLCGVLILYACFCSDSMFVHGSAPQIGAVVFTLGPVIYLSLSDRS